MISLRIPNQLRARCQAVRTIGGKSRDLSDICRCSWTKARKLGKADRRVVLAEFQQSTTRAGSMPWRINVPENLERWAEQYSGPELCAFIAWAIHDIPEIPAVPRELQVTHE